MGIIRGVEVELQSASKDLQDTAKLEKDKMRKWGKLAEEARAQLAAASPDGAAPVCRIVTGRSLKIELDLVIRFMHQRTLAHSTCALLLCSPMTMCDTYGSRTVLAFTSQKDRSPVCRVGEHIRASGCRHTSSIHCASSKVEARVLSTIS